MKEKKKSVKVIICLVLAAAMALAVVPPVYAATSTRISDQDAIKMAEALNMSTESESYSIGTNEYDIFDFTKEGFKDLFVNSGIPDFDNKYFSGRSRSEFGSQYASKTGVGAGVGVNVPMYNVSANLSANFEMSVNSSLDVINEEYFEYYERYQQTRVITVNWLSNDLSEYFSDGFIRELNRVNSVRSAADFLEKYGTHVFGRYYIGGALIITNYIASEQSIKEQYEEKGLEINLSTNIANAVSSNTDGKNYQMEGRNVSNESTKSKMRMHAYGGNSFNALNVDDLFTYNKEVANDTGSGFVYKAWIESFDRDGVDEVVIKVENPVPIWDLLDNSIYSDAAKKNYLKQAYEMMCYGNYSELCNEYGIDSDIIGSVTYSANGSQVKFDITSDTIRLPSGITATIEPGSALIDNLNAADARITLESNYDYAKMSGNSIVISRGSKGKSFVILVSLYDEVIYKLNVIIDDGGGNYSIGYGTADQPYLISGTAEWNNFLSNSNTYTGTSKKYYKLASDLDLNGSHYEVGGASAHKSFIGVLDGDGHTVLNFSVISQVGWSDVGLIGINIGTVKNITIDNARIMNSEIIGIQNGNINAGILVGENKGTIANVQLKNSSIRITGQMDASSSLNVGAVCGLSKGYIYDAGVAECNVYGQSWKNDGTVNVGGVVGYLGADVEKEGIGVERAYVRDTDINAYNWESGSATYALGGIVGYAHGEKKGEDELKSKLGYCLAYGNTFCTQKGDFGYIGGKATNYSIFGNCYFASYSNQAVGGNSMSGCRMLREMTLSGINNSAFYADWTEDGNGNVILRKHR